MSTTHERTSLTLDIDKCIDYLAISLTLFSTALNITIILNIFYCLLYFLSTVLVSLGNFLTASENIIGFIAITYCTAVLGLAGVTFFDIAGQAMEDHGDGLALERLFEEDLVDRLKGVVQAEMEDVVEPVLEVVGAPELEAGSVRRPQAKHKYSNLTC
ncbi:hypothetical protein E2P81_ATG11147 [Venturia nashicola]|uniref:Uncharacterized protein n=1 Tax=Venturia nashicola TaxID=86259 RepID=A0A4Z1P0D4_9PEZI|nr:hypothetical protein E6O75_ATG10827 [Venturia nashicola]TLD35028.1 hypothetical protein E2P81_ATG11147 [Venturia nashicola]